MEYPTERPAAATQPRSWALTAIAGVAAICIRVFALLPNIKPVGAIALYSGGRLPLWMAWLPPLAVMAVADLLLRTFFAYPMFDLWVYGSFLVYVIIGRLLCRTNSAGRIFSASVLGSLQFYLITNFGAWYAPYTSPAIYAPTFDGLIACYIAGLPFLGYTLLGDIVCSAMLFGADACLAHAKVTTPAREELRV